MADGYSNNKNFSFIRRKARHNFIVFCNQKFAGQRKLKTKCLNCRFTVAQITFPKCIHCLINLLRREQMCVRTCLEEVLGVNEKPS